MFVVLLVFQKIRNSFIVSWTSAYSDFDIARSRLRVPVGYIGSGELYKFNKIE
jgi:hypothetical protein